MTKQKYVVAVDDNFHFTDESESYNSGVFNSYEEAVAKCKTIIDEFLEDAIQPGDTPEGLYSTFVMYGETPHIHGENLGDFSALEYTRQRCQELCANQSDDTKKPFMARPLPGETADEFKARLKKSMLD